MVTENYELIHADPGVQLEWDDETRSLYITGTGRCELGEVRGSLSSDGDGLVVAAKSVAEMATCRAGEQYCGTVGGAAWCRGGKQQVQTAATAMCDGGEQHIGTSAGKIHCKTGGTQHCETVGGDAYCHAGEQNCGTVGGAAYCLEGEQTIGEGIKI